MNRAERGISIMIGAACGVAILVAVAYTYVPLLLFGLATRSRLVLTEDHRERDFSLYVREVSLYGTDHTIYARTGGSRSSSEVARVFAGDWFDTPAIDGETLRFEWHEEERLVVLLGSVRHRSDAPLHLALMRFDASGTVTEVPIDVENVGAVGDNWGSEMRKARSAEIERILDGRERPLPGTATATLAPP